MTRLARVRDTDACHGEEVYVRYASPLFFCYLRSPLVIKQSPLDVI